MEKMQWERPELLVLVRSKPEEAVLANCKTLNGSSKAGNGSKNGSCQAKTTTNCGTDCSAPLGS